MSKKVLFMALFLFLNNFNTMKSNEDSRETLIRINYKMIENGYFSFICRNNNDLEMIIYWYYINIKEKKVFCSKGVRSKITSEEVNSGGYESSADFRKKEIGTWREKYFKQFSEDFLDRTNDEKIILLDSISKSKDNKKEQLDKNDALLLNEAESAFLNQIFKDIRGNFDFTGKKVGFVKCNGESGKKTYFDMQEKHSIDKSYPCTDGELCIFNATQKAESGGYDAAITYWCKFVIPVEKIVKRLKKQR